MEGFLFWIAKKKKKRTRELGFFVEGIQLVSEGGTKDFFFLFPVKEKKSIVRGGGERGFQWTFESELKVWCKKARGGKRQGVCLG